MFARAIANGITNLKNNSFYTFFGDVLV